MERNYYIEYLGQAVELPLGETVVGRDISCRLRFHDAAVSRRHLRFVRREDELFVEDLRSSNGTLLNRQPITAPVPLRDGDALEVGGVSLVLRIVEGELSLSDTFVRIALAIPEAPPPPAVQAARTATTKMRAVTLPPEIRGARPDEERASVARRREERCAVELPLVYVSSELEIEATSLDLSPSGVFVCTEVLDPVGTACQLTLLLDGAPPLRVAGVVRRVVAHDASGRRESGLGVEFTRIGAAERAWLTAVIARQRRPA